MEPSVSVTICPVYSYWCLPRYTTLHYNCLLVTLIAISSSSSLRSVTYIVTHNIPPTIYFKYSQQISTSNIHFKYSLQISTSNIHFKYSLQIFTQQFTTPEDLSPPAPSTDWARRLSRSRQLATERETCRAKVAWADLPPGCRAPTSTVYMTSWIILVIFFSFLPCHPNNSRKSLLQCFLGPKLTVM